MKWQLTGRFADLNRAVPSNPEGFSLGHWVFVALQLAAIPMAILWWRHLPPPGYAVAVIAILAALMSIHGDIKPWQKAAWMLLMGAFLIIEFDAIAKDRQDNELH